jgi:hypothetical protein
MPSDAEPLVNEPEFTNDEIEMIALFRKAPSYADNSNAKYRASRPKWWSYHHWR